MTRSKIRTSGAEGLTLSSTSLTVANGLTLTDGDIAFADGHGLTFAATGDTSATGASTANEVMHDYEEGSWTPTLSGGTFTIDTQRGQYTKIGRYVFCNLLLEIGDTFDLTHTTGYLIAGLPFVSSNNSTFALLSNKLSINVVPERGNPTIKRMFVRLLDVLTIGEGDTSKPLSMTPEDKSANLLE